SLSLVGIFLTENGSSEAIIEETKKNEQEIFTIGQNVFDQGTIKSILVDRVELLRNGQSEWLVLEESLLGSDGPVDEAPEGSEEILVDEGELNTALDNLPLLLTQARAVPYFKDGK